MNREPRPLHVALVVLAAFLFSLRISQRLFLPEKPEAPGIEETRTGLPGETMEKIQTLEKRYEKYQGMNFDQIAAALREDPRDVIAFALLGLYSLGIMAFLLAGVALLIYALARRISGKPVMARLEGPQPRWGLWDFLVAFSVMIVLSTGFSLIIPRGSSLLLFVAVPANLLACWYGAVLVRRKYGQSLRDIGVRGVQWAKNIGRGLLGYIATLPILLLAGTLATSIARASDQNVTVNPALTILSETRSVFVLILLIIAATIIIPACEEFLFRGLLYGALRKRMRAAWAITLTAAIFAAAHVNLFQFLPLFVIGALLAWLMEHTRSLVTSTAVHMLHNAFSVLTIVLIDLLF